MDGWRGNSEERACDANLNALWYVGVVVCWWLVFWKLEGGSSNSDSRSVSDFTMAFVFLPQSSAKTKPQPLHHAPKRFRAKPAQTALRIRAGTKKRTTTANHTSNIKQATRAPAFSPLMALEGVASPARQGAKAQLLQTVLKQGGAKPRPWRRLALLCLALCPCAL